MQNDSFMLETDCFWWCFFESDGKITVHFHCIENCTLRKTSPLMLFHVGKNKLWIITFKNSTIWSNL